MRMPLHFAQVLMDELHSDRTFSHAGSDALHRAMAYITNRKYTGYVCFEQKWIPFRHPAFGTFAVSYQITARQDETAIISFYETCQPVGLVERGNKNEHSFRPHPL